MPPYKTVSSFSYASPFYVPIIHPASYLLLLSAAFVYYIVYKRDTHVMKRLYHTIFSIARPCRSILGRLLTSENSIMFVQTFPVRLTVTRITPPPSLFAAWVLEVVTSCRANKKILDLLLAP
jgi:hypothetical protein